MFHRVFQSRGERAWRVLATTALAAVMILDARAAEQRTLVFERTIPIRGQPIVAPDGSIWLIGADGTLRHGPAPIPADGTAPDERGWTTIPAPAGYLLVMLEVSAEGELWAIAQPRGERASRVWRLSTEGGKPAWAFEPLPLAATAMDIASGPSGEVWVGGEWRDLFLRTGGRWERLVPPVPYHVERVIPTGEGAAWLLMSTRSLGAVVRVDPAGMRVVHRGAEMQSEPVFFSHGAVAIAMRESVLQIRASGTAEPERVVGLPGSADGFATLSESLTGWVSRGATLARWVGGRTEWSGSAPFRIGSIVDLGSAGLHVTSPDGDYWRLARSEVSASSRRREDVPGFDRVEVRDWLSGDSNLAAIASIEVGGRRGFYLVDHYGANLLIGGDEMISPPLEPVQSWRTAASRLGIEGPQWNAKWAPAYDNAALVADLDGDSHEDLILFTMYGGIRVFRNAGGRRFVDWTRESSLESAPLDDVMGGCLLDADADGDLDLYAGNLLVGDRLFRNNGAAVFEEVTTAAAIETGDGTESATCVDLDGDGDTDIAVATWGRGVLLHENRGVVDGVPRFVSHRLLADRGDRDGRSALSTLNVNRIEAADLDRDALPELFVAVQSGRSILLRNRGGFRFEADLTSVERIPEDRTRAAAFADLDHDGDLDLLTTGRDGLRLWRWDGGRFESSSGPAESRPAKEDADGTDAMLATDVDGDGDLDALWGTRSGPLIFERNRLDDDRSILLRIEGPPGNRSAVGAQVELFPSGGVADPARRLGWRYVGGSAGGRSQGGNEVHFGGIPRATAFDVVIRFPDGTRRVVTGLQAPFRGTIEAVPKHAARWGGALTQHARRLLGDPWTRRWAVLTLIGAVALAAGVLVLYRRASPGFAAWSAVAIGPAISFAAYLFLPLDPGYSSIVTAPVVGMFAAGMVLAFVRSLMAETKVPELIGELSFALRTFRHNQTPQRVLERLRFDLENLGDGEFPAGAQRAALLQEDLRAYREVVIPELGAIVRLAEAAGFAAAAGSSALDVQKRAAPALLRVLAGSPAGTPIRPALFDEIRASIAEATAWIDVLRVMTDARLSIDLPDTVRAWVASRREGVPIPIEFTSSEREPFHVRFLAAELHRVLDILLENAARALASRPRGRIEVRLERDGPRRACLVFSDNGPGIPESIREAVFSLGFTRGSGGEGYGLYYARRAMQRFGGAIVVGVPAEDGASFIMTLEVVPHRSGENAA